MGRRRHVTGTALAGLPFATASTACRPFTEACTTTTATAAHYTVVLPLTATIHCHSDALRLSVSVHSVSASEARIPKDLFICQTGTKS